MAVSESWNYMQIQDFHNRVRSLLDNISQISLEDKFVDMPEKAPYADIYVKTRVPNWNELDESKFKLFESAIVYKTASLFESLVNQDSIKKKELPTITIEYFARKAIDYNGLSLSELADLLISEISGSSGVDFIGFMVTQ